MEWSAMNDDTLRHYSFKFWLFNTPNQHKKEYSNSEIVSDRICKF